MMDMLLGLASNYDQQASAPINHYVNQTPSVYIMDNWHVTPRLSLQLGIRYDALPHAWERNNHVANFDPSYFLASATPNWNADGRCSRPARASRATPSLESRLTYYTNGMRIAGQGGFPKGLVTNDYNTWQPRLGFSEDLFGNGKTVLRGGFGTFYRAHAGQRHLQRCHQLTVCQRSERSVRQHDQPAHEHPNGFDRNDTNMTERSHNPGASISCSRGCAIQPRRAA